MSRVRSRGLPVLRVLLLLGAGGAWAIACGGPQPLGAAGSVCFRADDCQAGLACVRVSMGSAKHVCSADLSGIVSMVDGAAPDGDPPEATGGSAPLPEGGSSSAGTTNGSAGKAAGGATSTGGRPGTAGAPASGGGPVGGSPGAAGASTAGTSAGGSPSGGAENGGSSAGTGG